MPRSVVAPVAIAGSRHRGDTRRDLDDTRGMTARAWILIVVAITAGSLTRPRTAAACSPSEYLTPVDLADRAAVVAVVDVTALTEGDEVTVTATRVEALKGAPAATVTLRGPGGSCEAGFAVGRRGIVFADGAGQVIGLYSGLLTEPLGPWTAALRAYLDGPTAADRADALADLAAARDWSTSFAAAHALADRVELLGAITAPARARLVQRAARRTADHPIRALVLRLHEPPPTGRARRRTAPVPLAGVAAGLFETSSDPAVLADAIATPRAGAGMARRCDLGRCFTAAEQTRIAAFERCERVHGRTLDRFSLYLHDGDPDAWRTRADACRTGTPIAPAP